jgi:hypothetical protein
LCGTWRGFSDTLKYIPSSHIFQLIYY